MKIRILLLLLISVVIKVNAARDYGISEKLGEYIDTSIIVIDKNGDKHRLIELIDKPTILSFSYYHCTGQCDKLFNGIGEIFNYSDYLAGVDYQVFTLSIDIYDDIRDGIRHKHNVVDSFNIPLAIENWKFYTVDSSSINLLQESTGYHFFRENLYFIHPLASILVSPKGLISHYFYGTHYLTWHFRLAIDDAKKEQVTAPRRKTVKYCYNFTPEENHVVRQIVVFSGSVILIVALGLFVFLVVIEQRKKKGKHEH